MEFFDTVTPFICVLQLENLNRALELIIVVDKILAILLRAIYILLVPGTLVMIRHSARGPGTVSKSFALESVWLST